MNFALPPEEMVRKLLLRLDDGGWEETFQNERIRVLRREAVDAPFSEIIVPSVLTERNLPLTLSTAIEELARASKSDVRSAIEWIEVAEHDVFSFRFTGPEVTPNGIRLGAMNQVMDGVKRAMSATANNVGRSTRKERPSGVGPRDYPNEAEFGHTGRGSFIVRVLHDVHVRPVESDLLIETVGTIKERPLASTPEGWLRAVGLRFQSAVELSASIAHSSERTDEIGVDECLASGLDVNVAESLRTIAAADTRSVFLSFDYSAAVQSDRPPASQVILPPEASERLGRLVDRLGNAREPRPRPIAGMVVGLATRNPLEGGSIKMDVRLRLDVDGRLSDDESDPIVSRSLSAHLDRSEYQTAIQAHRESRALHMRGVLEKFGRSYYMSSVESVFVGERVQQDELPF